MTVFSTRITSLSTVSGLLGLMFVASSSGGQTVGIAPFPGGGNPPMPPIALTPPDLSDVVGYFTSPLNSIVGSLLEAPMPGGGNPPMPPITLLPPTFSEAPMPGGGNPPMPPSNLAPPTFSEAPMPGGGNPPMPPSNLAPPTFSEAPMPGGGNPPMPPSNLETPMTGGGNPPMPPSAAVVGIVSGIAIYADGTIGYPDGDFQFTSGAYLWADGFVRYSSAPGDFVWTNYAGSIIVTTLGDVAANGLPHVEYPELIGIAPK